MNRLQIAGLMLCALLVLATKVAPGRTKPILRLTPSLEREGSTLRLRSCPTPVRARYSWGVRGRDPSS